MLSRACEVVKHEAGSRRVHPTQVSGCQGVELSAAPPADGRPLSANDRRQCPERRVDRRAVGEHIEDLGIDDDDVRALSVPGRGHAASSV